jgi:uncharacterized protein YecT (DUF1311 family)
MGAIRIGITMAAACMLSVPVQANVKQQSDDGTSATYKACMASGDAADGITLGINNCTGAEIDRQDEKLNKTYRATLARLSPARRAVLRAAERKWIPARDRRCRRESDEDGDGTLGDMMYRTCIMYETINRTLWLKAYR